MSRAGELLKSFLATSDADEDAAEELVAAYLQGAHKYDVPLPSEFRDDISLEEAEKEMREDLHKEALAFIRAWREGVVATLESGPTESSGK